MNGWQVVFPSDPRQARTQYKNLYQENRRLRARVRELERLVRILRGRPSARTARASRASHVVGQSILGTASMINYVGFVV